MTKRSFFKRVGALIAAATIAKKSSGETVWGLMTVERHWTLKKEQGIDLHIFDVHGVDVTARCRFWDDTPGRRCAELYLHRDGRPFLNADKTGAAKETITDFTIRALPI